MAKTIKLDLITKIEGHAKLYIKISKDKVEKVKLDIFEGSRFFEGILKDKKYNDLSHISSRICGVCSVVHSIASIKATENAFKVKVSEQTNLLRELLHIAGIIQSHILHLYFFVLPDYLGYPNALAMLPKYKESINRALRLKKAGNEIVRVVGGRDVHPITNIVGGFSVLPDKDRLYGLLKVLKYAKKDATATTKLFCSLKHAKYERYTEHFALQGGSYFYSDKIVSCVGKKCFPTSDYEKHFKEYFKEGATSKFATEKGQSYMVGALSRIVNNNKLLSKAVRECDCVKRILSNKFSPYTNNLAQAVEILEGVNRCIEIIENLKFKHEKPVKVKVKKSTGIGTIEAPRGILFHKYCFDNEGFCTFANITTPTTQNLQSIEDNIRALLPKILDNGKEEIKLKIEKLIRAYDPCISCATHFLEMNIQQKIIK